MDVYLNLRTSTKNPFVSRRKGDLNHCIVQCTSDTKLSKQHWTVKWLRSPFSEGYCCVLQRRRRRMTFRCILSRTARNRCNSACNQKLINNESGKDSKDEVDALSFISEKSARSYLSEKAILTNAQCHSSMLF